jgi:hypothetical protein
MADSENSRTLPSNRYRNLLSDTAHLLSEMAVKRGDESNGDTTEALANWAAWSLAHADYSRLCIIQQGLEGELFRTAAVQRNESLAAAASIHGSAPSESEASGDMPPRIESDLALRGRQWEAADEAAGHSRARVAEDAASARAQLLAADLWSVSGQSAVSAMAKLHCLLEQGEPVPGSGEFPWPQIRSALADLLMATTPNTATLPGFRERRTVARLA